MSPTWAGRVWPCAAASPTSPRPPRRPDIAFNFDAPDIDKVMKIAGEPRRPASARSHASGGVAGTARAVHPLRELTFVAGTDTGVKVWCGGSAPGAATQARQPRSAFKGDVSVNGQTVESALGSRSTGRPMITADLKSTSLDLDRLSSRETPRRQGRRRRADRRPAGRCAG